MPRMPLPILEQTLCLNRFQTQSPTTRQLRFLELEGLDALYGGAAGGGKSAALLMAALQFAEVPGYAAIIFRRTFADLKLPGALIDKSHEWLAGTGARWNAQECRWRFPGGGSLQFGYLEHEQDVRRYQSSEFQFIGFDEATHFYPSHLSYLFSRLRRRRAIPVPLRYRLASNPGNLAHDYVKKRYINPGTPGKVFVPAKLADNPHLDQESYRRDSLSQLDPITRAQLEAGDWDAVAGGRFQRDWFRRFEWRGDYAVLLTPGGRKEFKPNLCKRFVICDPAASERKTADFTVLSTFCVSPWADLVWLGCSRFQAEIPDILPKLGVVVKRWRPSFVGIEAVAANRGVYQLACRSTDPIIAAMPLDPAGREKLAHATTAIILASGGRIYLPQNDATFPVEDVLAELVRFTGDDKQDAYDDIVDTLSYGAELMDTMPSHEAQRAVPRVIGG